MVATPIKYFGTKHRLAKEYGPPRLPIVIEPFAGACGYSCYWGVNKVIMVEKYKPLVDIWKFLIEATHDDIMDLPLVYSVDDFPDWVPEGARSMIRLWWSRGDYMVCRNKITKQNMMSVYNGSKGYWSAARRERIAMDVHKFNNWEIIHGDYTDAPDIEAHFHVDPPYMFQGKVYAETADNIDFEHLASWCRSRKGCVDVCEAEPANWLPFEKLRTAPSQSGTKYTEVIYRIDNRNKDSELFE